MHFYWQTPIKKTCHFPEDDRFIMKIIKALGERKIDASTDAM